MATQQQKEHLSLRFHAEAVARIRADARLLQSGRDTLIRWKMHRADTRPLPVFDTWSALLDAGAGAIEDAVCVDGEAAAALRSASPLGGPLSTVERDALRLACGLPVAPAWAQRAALAVPKAIP